MQDIKAAVERVKAASGKIVTEPYPVADLGLEAYFQDTEGNILGVWQDLQQPG